MANKTYESTDLEQIEKWPRIVVGVRKDAPEALGSELDYTPLQTDENGRLHVDATGPNISVATAFCGQVTVTTAGTAVQGGNVSLRNGVYVKALSGNTGKVYVWWATGDGRTGYELSPGEVVPVQTSNLNEIWFDAATNGDKFCWIKA